MENRHRTYSLLVPCYNAEPYIANFLRHISSLSRPFDEVIFYDDGSTDCTHNILLLNGQQVIQGKTNRGPGYARNRLAEAAKCSHIHFHDIDDEFVPEFLQLVDEVFAVSNPDVVVGDADWIDAFSRESIINWRYDDKELQRDPLAYWISHPLGIINTAYKKASFLKVKGFNEQLKCWEDADLHVRLAASGTTFVAINQVLAFSLRHQNGISADQLSCWDCRLSFLKKYLEDYRQMVPDEVFRTELKRVQTMYIVSGKYEKLPAILEVNAHCRLQVKTTKIILLIVFSRILPATWINVLLNFFRRLTHVFN